MAEFLPYRLSTTTNVVSEVISRAYETPHRLNVAEWRVLAVLGERETANQQIVCTATRMDKMSVSRATAMLEHLGFVARSKDPIDGRAYRLALTRAGKRVYADIVPRVRKLEQAMFAALSSRERRQLHELLARVEASALATLERA